MVIRFAHIHMRENIGTRSHEGEPTGKNGKEDTISFLDIAGILVRRRWLIIILTSAVALITLGLLVYSLIAGPGKWNPFPNLYKAEVKVLLGDSNQGNSLSSALNESGMGALSGLLGLSSTVVSTYSDLAMTLLKEGNIIRDTIAEEFDFVDKYEIPPEKMVKTACRAAFARNLEVKYETTSKILRVGYVDHDPEFSSKVANRTVELLMEQFSTLTQDKVRRRIEYLKQNIATVQKKSDDAVQSLIVFGKKYGLADSSLGGSSQMGIVTESSTKITELKARLFSNQIDLKLLREYLPESDPRVVRAKNEVELISTSLADIEKGSSDLSTSSYPSGKLPELAVQYAELSRDAKVQMAILTTLTQQLEAAKLEVVGRTELFQIVEKAEVPEARYKPARSKIAVLTVLSAFIVSVLIAFVLEYFSRAGQDPVEGEKLRSIKRMLSFGKKAHWK